MTSERREGGCACGAVRYTVTGDPIFVNNCHCRQCQQQTGSTSVVNAFFEADRLEMRGAVIEHTVVAGSGGPHVIQSCQTCGAALCSFYPRLGRLGVGLRVGTLDDPGAFAPDAVIFTDEAMPWVGFPEDIPRFGQTYDPREILPPERMERLAALARRAREASG